MKSVNLSELSSEELIEEAKKQKSRLMVLRVVTGFMVSVVIYNTVNQGFSIFIVTPLLFFVPFLLSMEQSYKEVQKEIESRKS